MGIPVAAPLAVSLKFEAACQVYAYKQDFTGEFRSTSSSGNSTTATIGTGRGARVLFLGSVVEVDGVITEAEVISEMYQSNGGERLDYYGPTKEKPIIYFILAWHDWNNDVSRSDTYYADTPRALNNNGVEYSIYGDDNPPWGSDKDFDDSAVDIAIRNRSDIH